MPSAPRWRVAMTPALSLVTVTFQPLPPPAPLPPMPTTPPALPADPPPPPMLCARMPLASSPWVWMLPWLSTSTSQPLPPVPPLPPTPTMPFAPPPVPPPPPMDLRQDAVRGAIAREDGGAREIVGVHFAAIVGVRAVQVGLAAAADGDDAAGLPARAAAAADGLHHHGGGVRAFGFDGAIVVSRGVIALAAARAAAADGADAARTSRHCRRRRRWTAPGCRTTCCRS